MKMKMKKKTTVHSNNIILAKVKVKSVNGVAFTARASNK